MTDEEKDLQEAVERCESMWINICRADQSAIETVLGALRTAQARVTELETALKTAQDLADHRAEECVELVVKNAELEQDKARLDWLENRNYICLGHISDASGRYIQIETAGYAERGINLRAAIDAAMKDPQQ